MFKVKLSSNFFISLSAVVALGVVGCGGSGNGGSGGSGVAGHGGTSGGIAGNKGGGGSGVAGGKGGAGVGLTGGNGVGAGGGGVAVGGSTGAGAGGAGGGSSCLGSETSVCTAGTAQCAAGAPQTCMTDPVTGCTFWGTTPGQPAMCSVNQTCVAATGTCVCKDDPMCGTPPAAGDFCPVEGAGTHSACIKQPDGCFTVTAGTACDAGKTCNTASVATIVGVGAACGCPPVIATAAITPTTKLIGTGCPTLGARIGSPGDDAILVCSMAGTCLVWTSEVPCSLQQLTAGSDPVTGKPACVCKAPAKAGQYWVDPNPTMSTFMNGDPSGAQFPAACRFRTLTTALAQTAPVPTEVVSQHESSSNVHFLTNTGLAGVADCTLPNTCEAFPLKVPAAVHMYTADVGSFNPNHYVVDIDIVSTGTSAVVVGSGAIVEGYTFDASATTQLNQGCIGSGTTAAGTTCATPLSSVISSPVTSGTVVAPSTATLNQLQIFLRQAGNGAAIGGTYTGQTGVLIQGQGAWTAHFLTVLGGAPATGGTAINRGIFVTNRQVLSAGTALSINADHLNLNIAGTAPQTDIGIETGTTGDEATTVTQPFPSTVTVTNDGTTDHAMGRGIRVGAGGTGILVHNGMVTTTGLDVTSSVSPTASLTGYNILNSNSPAAMGVNINTGLITGGNLGGVGVMATGGVVTVNQTHITGGTAWTGVNIQSTRPISATSIAGDVTLTGVTGTKTTIDTIAGTNTTAIAGIVVGSGIEYTGAAPNAVLPTKLSRLTITDHTAVTGYTDGLVINNGHVISTGTDVSFMANGRDGVQILSDLALGSANPVDPVSRVSITGATISGNGRGGVLVRDVAPVSLDSVKVTGNGTPITGAAAPNVSFATAGNVAFGGIDVQRSQLTGSTGFLFTLTNSVVSGNAGCGVTLSGGSDDLVNRTTATTGGNRACGFGGTGNVAGFDTVVTTTAGAVVAGGNANGPAPAAASIYGGRTNTGGRVSATIGGLPTGGNTIQNNTGVGLYITEARDFDPTSGAGDDVTEATVQGNKVTGNQVLGVAMNAEPQAGGINIASSNFTSVTPPGADDLGCEMTGANCTRVRMDTFFGNVVECNGKSQVGFAIPQRLSTTATGSGWSISSDASLVGVMLADRCTAPAHPNTLAGYTASTGVGLPGGLGIPMSATDATGHSLIHVDAYGVFWNTSTLASGTDYSSALAAAPQGNGDASTWGVCPGAVAVACPVALVQ